MARARNHSIVNLQHVKRRCEVEQIDRQAEDQCSHEVSAASRKDLPHLVGFGIVGHAVNFRGATPIQITAQRRLLLEEPKKHQIILMSIFFNRLRQAWRGVSS